MILQRPSLFDGYPSAIIEPDARKKRLAEFSGKEGHGHSLQSKSVLSENRSARTAAPFTAQGWRSIGRSASLFGSALVNSQMKNSVAPCDRCGNHTAAVYKSLNLNDAGSTTDYNGNRSMA